jgi:hypothetical protein
MLTIVSRLDSSHSVVWGEIRSFIKGSVVAAMRGFPLTVEEYRSGLRNEEKDAVKHGDGSMRRREDDELKKLKPGIVLVFWDSSCFSRRWRRIARMPV